MKLGSAFVSMLEHLDPRRLPIHGGDATTVVVTIDHAPWPTRSAPRGWLRRRPTDLRRRGPPPGVHRQHHPGRPRREVRDPRPRPLPAAVLPGPTQSPPPQAQRCRARGCRVKAAWTEAHHLRRPWAQGGPPTWTTAPCSAASTNRAHDPRYETRVDADGDVTFIGGRSDPDPGMARGNPLLAARSDRRDSL